MSKLQFSRPARRQPLVRRRRRRPPPPAVGRSLCCFPARTRGRTLLPLVSPLPISTLPSRLLHLCRSSRPGTAVFAAAAAATALPPPSRPPLTSAPQVMLSLLLNMLLLGGSMVWWSGGGLLLGSPQQQGGGGGQVRGAAGFERCERGELDEAKLNEWGCKMFHKACFDQVWPAAAATALQRPAPPLRPSPPPAALSSRAGEPAAAQRAEDPRPSQLYPRRAVQDLPRPRLRAAGIRGAAG